jgi:CBS domain-containing protein
MKVAYPISALLHYKTSRLWTVSPATTVFDAIKLMAEKNIGSLLVMSGDSLAGVFTERDYSRKIALQGKSSRETLVGEVMSTRVLTVGMDDTVENCMRLMTENRIRHLPVLGQERVLGIVSIGDLVNWIISTQDATIAQMERYIAGGLPA